MMHDRSATTLRLEFSRVHVHCTNGTFPSIYMYIYLLACCNFLDQSVVLDGSVLKTPLLQFVGCCCFICIAISSRTSLSDRSLRHSFIHSFMCVCAGCVKLNMEGVSPLTCICRKMMHIAPGHLDRDVAVPFEIDQTCSGQVTRSRSRHWLFTQSKIHHT
jgi:hypothetical protein